MIINDLQALAAKWRKDTRTGSIAAGYASHARKACADELTELMGKLVVSDDMAREVVAQFISVDPDRVPRQAAIDMRIILEAALGVTK